MTEPRAAITTILFTDLVNSTELMQRVGDETAQGLFQAHHRLLQDAVTATGGDELQWMGDGLMVAFDSTAEAVRCAVAMQQAAGQQISGHELAIRVGLNVGETLQQESGSGYFGTPVVIAKRLCDRAEAGQILCTSTVSGLLAGRAAFEFRDLGSGELKGISGPVPISEVIYEAKQEKPMLRHAPFVGRGDEVVRLTDAYERACSDAGELLMVVGEPGIGKTRILEELCTSLKEKGAQILWGGCYEGDRDPPYCPFSEAMTEHARRADPEELEKDLGHYGAIVAKLVPELHARLQLPELPALGPDEERHRLLDGLSQFLFALAERAPLVLVLDDLHWADHGTLTLLRQLARFVSRHPLLVIGAYRDVELDRQHPLSDALAELKRETEYERILLRGIGPEAVGEMLETLASHEVPEALGVAIHAETAGNPFFIREVILHLAEEGKLYRSEGRWRTDFQIAELGIPEGVRQVIGRRLSRLSDEANKLLSVASGFNGCFYFSVAADVSQLDEMDALDALDEVLEAQLLRPASAAEAYDFSHALIRHTLYAEMNPSRQVRLHRRIAEALERNHGEAAGEYAGEIAQQYQKSAVLPGAEKGVAHCLAAADRGDATAAFEESAVFLRMALELLPDSDPRRPGVQGRLAIALARSFETEEAVRLAGEASEQMAEIEGRDAAADYLAEAASTVWQSAMTRLAWDLAHKGLEYAGDRRDLTWVKLRMLDIMRSEANDPDFPGMPPASAQRRELSDVLNAIPGGVEWATILAAPDLLVVRSRDVILADYPDHGQLMSIQAGDYRRQLPKLVDVAETSVREGALAKASLMYTIQARVLAAIGEFAQSQEAFSRSIELSERFRTMPYLEVQKGAYPLEYTVARGEHIELLASGMAASLATDAAENYWVRAAVTGATAAMMAIAGREDEAIRYFHASLPAVEAAGGWTTNYPLLTGTLASALWNLERTDQIDVLERNIREKVVGPDFRYIHYDGRLCMAWLSALQQRWDESIDWFAKSRVVLEEEGARPLRARVDYEEARMYMRRDTRGDRDQALRLFDTAIEHFRALGMDGWVPRAESLAATLR